jgi:hypothetical protein
VSKLNNEILPRETANVMSAEVPARGIPFFGPVGETASMGLDKTGRASWGWIEMTVDTSRGSWSSFTTAEGVHQSGIASFEQNVLES